MYLQSYRWFKQLLHDKDESQVSRAITALAILNEHYGPTKLEKHNEIIRNFSELGESQEYLDATMRYYNSAVVYEQSQNQTNPASTPAVDMTKKFDFDWLDSMKLERAMSKKKEGLDEMKQFIGENKILDPKADYSNIIKFLIGLARQTNNGIKKDAVEIAILLSNKLKSDFKK